MRRDRLSVAIRAKTDRGIPFSAVLSVRRAPLRGASVARFLVHPPLGARGTMAAIHYEALKLWWKGAPYHPHPRDGAACAHAAGGYR